LIHADPASQIKYRRAQHSRTYYKTNEILSGVPAVRVLRFLHGAHQQRLVQHRKRRRGALQLQQPEGAAVHPHAGQRHALGLRQRPQVRGHHPSANEHGRLPDGAGRHDRRQRIRRRPNHAGTLPQVAAGLHFHAGAPVLLRALAVQRPFRKVLFILSFFFSLVLFRRSKMFFLSLLFTI